MPTVSSFVLPGIKCWFWSHDHDPPHFHAKKDGHWEVRVYFLLDATDGMLEYKRKIKDIASTDRKRLIKAVEANRESLLGEWEVIRDVI